MNILFVNYGDFTTNSLNHIAGFANALCASGHACAVAVSGRKETLGVIPGPMFIPVTYEEALGKPGLFPDGRPADLIHAWTPRENVRRFVLGYQRHAHARLIVHLEDNEEFLLSAWLGRSGADVGKISEDLFGEQAPAALSHPRRYRQFLRAADGATVIVESLKRFVPEAVPCALLPPGVDPARYHPRPPDAALRGELGLRDGERAILFTGSNTFANEPEMRDLYVAVALLNARGIPARLVRAGYNSPRFQESLPETLRAHVLDLGFIEKARLPALLAIADVLVQPGRAGPFNDFRLPSKLPEYFASGRPVVLPAANVGNEVRDGVDAILLKTGSPEEIADACERVFGDPALAAALSKNAAAFARRRFDLAANTKRLADFYERIRKLPVRPGSTAGIVGDESELTLALRALAAQTSEPNAAALAADLAPLVEDLERRDPGRGERLRLERECATLQEANELTRRHAANLEHLLAMARRDIELARQHARNFEGSLASSRQETAQSQQLARNLERLLEEARSAAAELQARHAEARSAAAELQARDAEAQRQRQKLAMSEKLLASARRQLDALDRELDAVRIEAQERQAEATADQEGYRARISKLEDLLRLNRQHAANLEQLWDARKRRVQELDGQCKHLEREIGRRDGSVEALQAKVRAMTRSRSWRITQPLRFLRRLLLDPRGTAAAGIPPPPPSSDGENGSAPAAAHPERTPTSADLPGPSFFHSIDEPAARQLAPGVVRFRGWCFADDARKLTSARAVLADRTVEGKYGIKRPDVVGAMPGKPQAAYCGWEIEMNLNAGDTAIAFEVADTDADWHRFSEIILEVGHDFDPVDPESYEEWISVHDRHSPADLLAEVERSAAFAYQPLISVLMPVYNAPERWLRRAIDSVCAQTYPHWELCIADDTSTAEHVRPILEAARKADRRIKVDYREQNGHISVASNSALALAEGEFVALLDHDDELAPNALFEVASALNAQPDADFLYSDEDKIDEGGVRHSPYFKPDWQPDLMLGQNYTAHLSVYRAELVRAAGDFREGFEGSQDWDLALRMVERTQPERIVHIPRILYHWRAIEGSTALHLSEKNYHEEAARRALADHLGRVEPKAEILPVSGGHWRVKHPLPADPPLVSLIIPTRNGVRLLERCVRSILAKTTYPHFEVIVVDNESDDVATVAYLRTLENGTPPTHGRVRVLPYHAPFNFSAINNFAVSQAKGEIVGLLNNDIEVISADWLEEMASHALRPEIGCVGAMLYYPDDTIQHAGCVLGIGGVAGHAFKAFPRGTEGKFNRARLAQNYSAVTAACLLVRKSVYEQVGGLDEGDLPVAFNDVDFCLKVRAAGYRNLWTPFAELYHHESASRGYEDTPEKHSRFRKEIEVMTRRWNGILTRDPAYNPNLTLECENFSLAAQPRRNGVPAK